MKKTASEKRKLFINEEVQYLDKIATENSSFTPQFYVTIWDKNVEHLQQRAKEMTEKYRKAGVNAKLLNLKEIVYVLTLYTDPVAALAEQDVDNIVEAVKAPVMYFSDDNWEEMWKWVKKIIIFLLIVIALVVITMLNKSNNKKVKKGK